MSNTPNIAKNGNSPTSHALGKIGLWPWEPYVSLRWHFTHPLVPTERFKVVPSRKQRTTKRYGPNGPKYCMKWP